MPKGKVLKKKPSNRQRLAAEKFKNERKQKSQGTMLRECGYSEELAEHPTKVTQSKGFLQAYNKVITDELLEEKTLEAINNEDPAKNSVIKAKFPYINLAHTIKGHMKATEEPEDVKVSPEQAVAIAKAFADMN